MAAWVEQYSDPRRWLGVRPWVARWDAKNAEILRELWRVDFRTPATQPDPQSAAEVVALDLPSPAHLHLLSGGDADVPDEVGSLDLTDRQAVYYQQIGVGIWNGSSTSARKVVEFASGSGRLAAPSGATLDIGDNTTTDEVAGSLLFRCPIVPSSSGGICGKFNSTQKGWILRIDTSGRPAIRVDDGTTNVLVTLLGVNVCDGAWHRISFRISRADDTIDIWTDLGDDENNSFASVTGSLAVTEGFRLGQLAGGQAAIPIGQLASSVIWTDANAAALDSTITEKLFKVGADPRGNLTTATHGTLLSSPVADDATLGEQVCHYTGVGTHGVDQLPFEYKAQLTHPGQLGLRINEAVTNYCTWSEALTTSPWTAVNATITANDANAPDGFRTATKVVQTGINGRDKRQVPGLTGSTQYTCSFWAWASGSQTATVEIRDSADAVVRATVSPALTAKRKRFSVTFTTGVAETQIFIRMMPGVVGVDTDKTAWFWGVQVETGAYARPYVRTTSATATATLPSYLIENATDESLWVGARGELFAEVTLDQSAPGTNRVVVDLADDVGLADRHQLLLNPAARARHAIYDGSAVLHENIQEASDNDGTSLFRIRCRWASENSLKDRASMEADLVVDDDGEVTVTDLTAGSWTANGAKGHKVTLGDREATGIPLNGVLARASVFDRERYA